MLETLKNCTSNLYFSKYIESFEYRIVAAGIDSGFKVCALNEQVVPDVYGFVINNGNYAYYKDNRVNLGSNLVEINLFIDV